MSKFPKKILLLIVNFVILVILLFALDYIVFSIDMKKLEKSVKETHGASFILPNNPWKYGNPDIYFSEYLTFRKPVGLEYGNSPIYLFGCSYAYGQYLEDDETFQYILSKNIKHPVYNYANLGWSIQHMLYLLENKNYDFDKTKPPFVIYMMIDGHWGRMFSDFFDLTGDSLYLKYEEKGNELVLPSKYDKPVHFYMHIYKKFKCFHASNILAYNDKKRFEFLRKHLIKAKQLINLKSPETKFIIYAYDVHFSQTERDLLEKDGFILISNFDLTDVDLGLPKYMRQADWHPTAEAWKMLTPLFVKKIKNRGLLAN